MTERLAERIEQLESRVDRVEGRMNGLATSAQITELHSRIDAMDNRINARLNDVTRVGIGIIIAILLAVVGLIVAGITQ
ncbi:MAG: hypothetical protein QF898_18580 [SAR202 cluster bacterium]|nr:hypothetical protein [SAR202 cluster bacterium]MDP6511749.1 hypothetical protein [SAR202 cluster bacterium]MDP6713883.1 hypothetical protein [SAR202 cluster bacterium]